MFLNIDNIHYCCRRVEGYISCNQQSYDKDPIKMDQQQRKIIIKRGMCKKSKISWIEIKNNGDMKTTSIDIIQYDVEVLTIMFDKV